MSLPALAAASLIAVSPPAAPEPVDLSFLEGEWIILDADGEQSGSASIGIPLDDAMIEERRVIGDKEPQMLWLAQLEHTGGWAQLFVSPAGIREFPRISAQGEWPIVFGGDVTLTNGTPARFRLTVDKRSGDEHHRLLEMSTDGGETWRKVLDYLYRRGSDDG